MLSSWKSWSFTILIYWDFPKNWSQKWKVGVTYSKSGVNEISDYVSSNIISHIKKYNYSLIWTRQSTIIYLFNQIWRKSCLVYMKLIALLVQKKFKTDFQHGCQGNLLGFPIRMILAIFYLQITPIFPIKFRVNGSFYSVQTTFLRRQLWRPSCISDRNNFSYFWPTSHLDDSYQVSS